MVIKQLFTKTLEVLFTVLHLAVVMRYGVVTERSKIVASDFGC